MSRITSVTEEVLIKYLKHGQRVLEIFPGDQKDSVQSLKLICTITGRRVIAVGKDDIPSPDVRLYMKLYRRRLPPYPRLWLKRFDVIFINQIYDLVKVEHHLTDFIFKFPKKGVKFINRKLKPNGIFILSKVHRLEAEKMYRWLQLVGRYSFEYIGDCGIFTKLL